MAFRGTEYTMYADVSHGESGGVWFPTGLKQGSIDNRLFLRADTANAERPDVELGPVGGIVHATSDIGNPATSIFSVTAVGGLRDFADAEDFGPVHRLAAFSEFPDGDPDFEPPDPDRFHDQFNDLDPRDPEGATTAIVNAQICVDTQPGFFEIVSFLDPTVTIMGPFQSGQGPVFMNGSSGNRWEFDDIIIPNGWGLKITDTEDIMIVSVTYRLKY